MILEKTRLQIANFKLRQQRTKVKRQKQLHDFASAKYIGIVCNTEDNNNIGYLKDFLHYLSERGIKYLVLGYFDGKKIPEGFLYWKDLEFFTRNETNLIFIPKSPVVSKFIAEPFDILINFCLKEYFPVKYIVQMSQAKFKAGAYGADAESYDLMIDVQKHKTVEYFIENLKLYLSNLRTPDYK